MILITGSVQNAKHHLVEEEAIMECFSLYVNDSLWKWINSSNTTQIHS